MYVCVSQREECFDFVQVGVAVTRRGPAASAALVSHGS